MSVIVGSIIESDTTRGSTDGNLQIPRSTGRPQNDVQSAERNCICLS